MVINKIENNISDIWKIYKISKTNCFKGHINQTPVECCQILLNLKSNNKNIHNKSRESTKTLAIYEMK